MARTRTNAPTPSGSGDLYEANQGFSVTLDGEQVWVKKGDKAEKGAAILKGRDELFDLATGDGIRFHKDASKDAPVRPRVEQATSGPGEQRGE